MKSIFALILVCAVSSAFAQQSAEQKKEAKAIQATVNKAKKLAALELSCYTDADCEVEQYGDRACGGPQGAIVYSVVNPNAKAVVSLAKKSVRLEQAYNAKYSIISICSMFLMPTPACVQNLCHGK